MGELMKGYINSNTLNQENQKYMDKYKDYKKYTTKLNPLDSSNDSN